MVFSAKAQTMYDALKFSENNYGGTARTMAMGNAFTALGGDLGSININPAGSAVVNYSQLTVTPSLSISATATQGSRLAGESQPFCFENKINTSYTRFMMPNIGFMMNFDTHRTSGLKNISVGIVANMTNDFTDNTYARGTNSSTTLAGALASAAFGVDRSIFESSDPYNNSSAPWSTILAWDARIIDPLDKFADEYVGTTENWYLNENDGIYDIQLADPIDQYYGRTVQGYKYDYVINLGANFSDKIYVGANLGITSMYYSSSDYIREEAKDPDMFQTGFTRLKYQNQYDAAGTGIYAKFGILATPFPGLRIGAAIQTPTSTFIKEHWQSAAQTYFVDSNNNASAKTPEGEYSYRLSSPFRFNIGAAYVFGNFAVVSVDYERADYGSMRFKEIGTNDNTEFDRINEQIQGVDNTPGVSFMGASNMLRAGVEIKPFESFALRAGYGLTTSPEKYYDDGGMAASVESMMHSFSFGLGYSSKGSFFCDLACKCTKYYDEYIRPYDDYIFNGDQVAIFSPEILNKKVLWNVVMTFGFRF